MILQNHIRGRRRVLDGAKKARLCELISMESYSVEQAAESLDVSLRTIQRERKYDQDFDHEVRLALQSPPDSLKLMEHAARTHWRAAAWLLERTKPEEFARKPVNTTSAKKVDAAFRYIQEAALAAIPAEFHAALYQQTQQAMATALAECFPTMGAWGQPKPRKLPFKTPLADVQWDKVWQAQTFIVPDRTAPVDERFDDRPELYVNVEVATDPGPIEVSLPPDHYRHMQQMIAAARTRENILSPKTSEATKCAPPRSHAPRGNATPDAPRRAPGLAGQARHDAAPATPQLASQGAGSTLDAERREERSHAERGNENAILSPKTPNTTKNAAATEFAPATKSFNHDPLATLEALVSSHCPEAWFENDDFDHPDAEDPQTRILLLDERLRRHQRRERHKARAAEKKVKAAKKRAEAQRRRAA